MIEVEVKLLRIWRVIGSKETLVVNMNRQAKKNFIAKAGHNPSENFWKTFKPYFDLKSKICNEKPLLVENDAIIDSEQELCEIFNNYYNGITDCLSITEIPITESLDSDPISNIIGTYAKHPSIQP